MSTIILAQQNFSDPSVVPIPNPSEFTIGFDLDGVPKIKYDNGSIVPLIGGNGPVGPTGSTGSSGPSVGGGNSLVWQAGISSTSGQFDYPNGNWGIINTPYDININRFEFFAGSDATNWFAALSTGINFVGPSKGIFSIYQTDDNTNFAIFTLNSIVDNTSFWTVNATLIVYGCVPSVVNGSTYNVSWVLFGKDAVGGGGTSSLTVQANSGIVEISGTSSVALATSYNTLLDDGLTTPNAVGGIVSGTSVASLKTKNLVQIVDDLLFPTVLPSYVNPTISISSTVTGIREVGSTYSSVINLSGVKNDAGAYTSMSIFKSVNGDSSTLLFISSPTPTSTTPLPSQFGYTNSNNPNFSYAISTNDNLVVVPTYSSSNSSITYTGFGNYSSGLALKDNKGLTDSRSPAIRNTSRPQLGDTNFGPATATVIGYYPYFYGKSATQQTASQIKSIIESGTGFTKVVNTGSGSLSMAFNAVGQWPWFAIFESYTTKTSWYENALNSGNIGNPTDLFLSPITLSIISADGYWVANYKIYPAGKVTTLGTALIS